MFDLTSCTLRFEGNLLQDGEHLSSFGMIEHDTVQVEAEPGQRAKAELERLGVSIDLKTLTTHTCKDTEESVAIARNFALLDDFYETEVTPKTLKGLRVCSLFVRQTSWRYIAQPGHPLYRDECNRNSIEIVKKLSKHRAFVHDFAKCLTYSAAPVAVVKCFFSSASPCDVWSSAYFSDPFLHCLIKLKRIWILDILVEDFVGIVDWDSVGDITCRYVPKIAVSLLETSHIFTNGIPRAVLHEACKSYGDSAFKLVKMLLERGVPVNEKDDAGKTPLYYAFRTRDVNIVSLLLSRGADPTIKNEGLHGCLPISAVRASPDLFMLGLSLTRCYIGYNDIKRRNVSHEVHRAIDSHNKRC
eukprot:TRINITY_DN797_c3_g1_i2.p1 TRINITY_DN797_c3_g1~~TRINITY_DN797_c3_g1_i2.p1  ORF type:complete len:401 (+),score=62.55 TRINITY_DN797_c3_g1_i2:132-1205(+)